MSRWLSRTFTSFTIDDQLFIRVAEKSHPRTNGSLAFLTTWKTTCPDCGAVFTFDHPTRPAPAYPVRRCKPCSKPGETVRTASSAQRTHSKANGTILVQPRPGPSSVDLPTLAAADVARQVRRHRDSAEHVDPSLALRRISEQQQDQQQDQQQPTPPSKHKGRLFHDR